jgi:hypothetical protein
VLEAFEGLRSLRKRESKRGSFSFRVAHAIKLLQPHVEAIEQIRLDLALKHGGEMQPTGGVSVPITAKFTAALKEHMDIEIEIAPFPAPITRADLVIGDVTHTADELLLLGPLFEDSPDQDQPTRRGKPKLNRVR